MVKNIIACGDLHIRNIRRMEEYQEQFQKFIDACRKYKGDETRIVITGDIFHNKLDISSEAYVLANWFLKQLDSIAKTIVIAGNHDLNIKNLERLSPIDTLFSVGKFKQTIFLDKELDYKSGCLVDDNIIWCLYSSFDGFMRPKIEKYDDGEHNLIGLIHTDVNGSKTDVGYSSDNGLNTSLFKGLDVCLCGHIHRRQKLVYDETDIIYTGSMIQQNHGENISGHGYIVWNIEDEDVEEYDIPNDDHGYYTFQIENDDDLDNDKEIILNL